MRRKAGVSSRAQDYEVEINAVNGWLDTLPAN
jgi:hypothetical protein